MTDKLKEWDESRRLTLLLSCCVLAVLILLFLIMPAKSFLAGLILGASISLYNVLYLARRARIAGQAAIAGRTAGSGFLNRVLMVVFGIILIYRFPEQLHYLGYVSGLPISYILIIVAAGINAKKGHTKREGRVVLGNHSEN